MNRILLSVGPITIYWYSVTILTAVLIGIYLAIKESKRMSMEKYTQDLVTSIIISGIIGARIYYVIFNFEAYYYQFLKYGKVA